MTISSGLTRSAEARSVTGTRRRHGVVALLTLAPWAPLVAQRATPELSLSGTLWVQYAWQLRADSALGGAHGNTIDVARSYLRLAGRFPDGVQGHITLDLDGRRAAANQQTVRLKYAYVAWAPPTSALSAQFGMIPTPWHEFEETLWGFRVQGTIPMERAGYLHSSDLGLALSASWRDGAYALQGGVFNGEGYGNAPGDHHKDLAVRGSMRLAATDRAGSTGGVRLSGYVHRGRATGGGIRSRTIGLVSYQSSTLTLAGQIGVTRDSVSPSAPDRAGRVVAAYATWRPQAASRFTLLGRVDQWDPDTDLASDLPATRLATEPRTRVIAGAAWSPSPHLRLVTSVDLTSVHGGSPDAAFDRSRQLLLFQTEVKF